MFDLIHKVITDYRVIAIFIIVAIYLEFVSFVASYKKKKIVRKATIRKAPIEQPPAAPPAESEEAAAEE